MRNMMDYTGDNFDFTSVQGKAEISFRHKDIDLSVARTKDTPLRIEDLAGRFIYVSGEAWDDEFTVSTLKQVGVASISFNDPYASPIDIQVGKVYKVAEGFDKLFVRNTAQANKMMRIFTSVNSEIIPFQSELEVIGAQGSNKDTVADVAVAATTTTAVLAVNANRKGWTISNLAVNLTVVRVGDSNTGAARGVELAQGASVSGTDTDAVYVYNPSASSINIGVLEVL